MKKHNKSITPESQHGTVSSYVIGFVLSLIFTIIPYYLVVNKVIAGQVLIIAILGIAVLQMFIQIFFFLHLGRGPKPFYNVVFFFATAGAIVIVVGASIFIMDNLYRNMSPEEYVRRLAQEENIAQIGGKETGACNEVKGNHIIVINDGVVSPGYTVASRCDSLTLINEDQQEREIMFGIYPESISYGGLFEIPVHVGDPETITLNETGEFKFYDVNNPEVDGEFYILPESSSY